MSAKQLNLFSQPSPATVVRDIKAAMSQAVKDSGLSRDQVLDRVNATAARHGLRLNGRGGISKDVFEKWLNPEDETRAPGLKALAVFCGALGTTAPIAPLVTLLGGMLIGGDDIKMLRWAKASWRAKRARKEIRELEGSINE